MAATTLSPTRAGSLRRTPVRGAGRLWLARALDRWATLTGLVVMALAAVATVVLG